MQPKRLTDGAAGSLRSPTATSRDRWDAYRVTLRSREGQVVLAGAAGHQNLTTPGVSVPVRFLAPFEASGTAPRTNQRSNQIKLLTDIDVFKSDQHFEGKR